LPAADRAKVQEALNVATRWNWENTAKENDKAYEKVTALGKKIHTLTPAQRQAWQKAASPVWDEFGTKLVGTEVMKRLKAIGGFKE
jgi:C4-dicarboxylate-binding protein DctP